MTVLSSIFFKGILLIAICSSLITQGRGATDLPDRFQSKRIYSTTAAGEEEELSTSAFNLPSEEADEKIDTTFDFKRKPKIVKSNDDDDDSATHTSVYTSWTTPHSKSVRENTSKGEAKNDDDKLFTKKMTVKYNEGALPSDSYSSSLPSVNKKFKNFEVENEETTTAASRNNKFVSSHSSYEYSSTTVIHLEENDGDEYTEEPQSHFSTTKNLPDFHKNSEWKNSELKKKNNKKDSSFDNLESVDKISIKTEKPVKDVSFKSDRPFDKNQENSSVLPPLHPEALDDYESTIKNISFIDSVKAIKNISVNNESGSNSLEIDTFSSKMNKNHKSEGTSDVPQSVNSVINKNSVTSENIETLNKTPTIRYSVKDSSFDFDNKTSPGFTPLRDAESTTYGVSSKELNYSKTLKLDDSKNIIPVWERSTEATFKLTSESTIVPDNDIVSLNVSTNENNYDNKKKILTLKTSPGVSSAASAVKDSLKETEIKSTTITSTVPRLNVNFKNKLGLSSTIRSKSLSTVSPLLSNSSSVRYRITTMLPTSENYKSVSKSFSSSSVNSSPENSLEEVLTTTPATTISNDLLIKPITGFSLRRRPAKLNFLSSTTSSEVISSTDPSITATKINFNYSTSSYRPLRRPTSVDNVISNINRTVSRSTTEAGAKVKPFVQWSTRLQKQSSSTATEPTVITSEVPTVLTTESGVGSTSENPSSVSAAFEPSTESSSTVEIWTKVTTSSSSTSSSTSQHANSLSTFPSPDSQHENFVKSSTNSYDLLSSSSTISSDLHSFPDTSETVTTNSISESTLTSNLPSSVTTESGDLFSIPNITLPSSLKSFDSTDSITSSSTSSIFEFSEKDNLQNSSEVTESSSPVSSSTVPYPSFETSETYTSIITEKSSSPNTLSTVDAVSESADAASSTTDSSTDKSYSSSRSGGSSGYSTTIDMLSSPSSLSSSSSSFSTTSSYSSSTLEEEDEEFLYTSESVNVFTSNETSSASPEFNVTSNDDLSNYTKYLTTTENIFDDTHSSSSSDYYYPLSNATTESMLEVTSVSSPSYSHSTVSTSLSDNYNISSTELPYINKNNSWTVEEVSTIAATTAHDIGNGDDSYDPDDDDWLINNTSDHHTSKHHNSVATSTTEQVLMPSVNPSSLDADTDLEDEDERHKNESFFTTEAHNINIHDIFTHVLKSNTTESTTLTEFEIDVMGNRTKVKQTSNHQSSSNVTLIPVTRVKNDSADPEMVLTTQAIETTTIVVHTKEHEITYVQHNTSASSKGNTTPLTPRWIVNNVPEYLEIRVDATLSEVCRFEDVLRKGIIRLFKNGTGRDLRGNQIAFLNLTPEKCSQQSTSKPVSVEMTFLNETGASICPNLIKDFIRLYNHKGLDTEVKVQDVRLMRRHEEDIHEEVNNSTTIAAITISCIAVVCLLLLGILLVILRKRQKGFNYGQRCTPVTMDDYSLDNISVYNSGRRKNAMRASKRSYGNPAFDDPGAPSHPLNFAGLANFCTNRKAIDEEYSLIPMVSPKMDELPPGAETKNRYANVIPLPETRVHLSVVEGGEPLSEYINANYVKGPKGSEKFYIACQAPLQSTVNDFWRMIWEQQCKIILMLTDLHENGVEKCYDYLPPSEVLDCHRLFGDYQVTLKKREVREKYVISLLQLKNLETNLWREVTHMWYMSWPHQGVPDEGTSIIAFLIEARSYMRSTSGPHVVHCSPGTGRTGTVLAIDLCIRDFEANRLVDIPKTVYALRRDRAGSVQTKDQYAFIYQVLNIYAAKLTGGALDSI